VTVYWRVKVRVSSRGTTLAEHAFDKKVITIGRGPACDVFIDNPIVSRQHAHIRREGSRFVLKPLSTTNSTEVNGQRVREDWTLAPGDLIVLSEKFHLHVDWDPQAARLRGLQRHEVPRGVAARTRGHPRTAAGGH